MHAHNGASPDVAVIGGGVIGLSVAWRAAQRGLRVTLLERGELGGGTSHVAAGMLAPVAEADPREQALMRLGILSARSYPAFAHELAERSGRDPGYLPCGTLLAARDNDEALALDRELAMRESLGLTARRLRASEARGLEPALTPGLRLALEFPEDHAVDPRRLTAALAAAASAASAVLRSGADVAEVIVSGGRARGVRLRAGGQLDAGHVVIAAGPWSAMLAGIPPAACVPLRPVKGQILRMHDPAGPGLLTRVLRMAPGYIVPRGDGRYVLGATMEERGFDRTITAGAVFELLRDAVELLPGIDELVIDELSAGLRPAAPDNAPVIGESATPGLIWATGHHRNGILLAPLTAEIVAGALAGEAAPLADEELAPFVPGRFAPVMAAV